MQINALSKAGAHCEKIVAGARKGISRAGGARLILLLALLLALPLVALAGDPTGTATGAAKDITAATSGQPTIEEIANEVGHTKIALNFVWVLVAGFLVMFCRPGLLWRRRLHARQERGPHDGDELHVLWLGVNRLLDLRLCADDGWRGGGRGVGRQYTA